MGYEPPLSPEQKRSVKKFAKMYVKSMKMMEKVAKELMAVVVPTHSSFLWLELAKDILDDPSCPKELTKLSVPVFAEHMHQLIHLRVDAERESEEMR